MQFPFMFGKLAEKFVVVVKRGLILKLLSLLPVIDGDKILLVSYLASIAPSASIVVQFSQINDSDTEYATAINLISTLACILTMPLFVMLFTNI